MAHELTHVVQQGTDSGSLPATLEIGNVETSLECEADTAADTVASQVPLPYLHKGESVTSAILQRACPRPPTGIGNTPSPEVCSRESPTAVSGPILLFYQDSTELTSGQEMPLQSIIADARRATRIEMHGNASTEGPAGDYNFNLSCKRAVAAENLL